MRDKICPKICSGLQNTGKRFRQGADFSLSHVPIVEKKLLTSGFLNFRLVYDYFVSFKFVEAMKTNEVRRFSLVYKIQVKIFNKVRISASCTYQLSEKNSLSLGFQNFRLFDDFFFFKVSESYEDKIIAYCQTGLGNVGKSCQQDANFASGASQYRKKIPSIQVSKFFG